VIVAVFTLQGASPARTILLHLGRDVLLAALIIPAAVTLIFAVWEYVQFRFRRWERWTPETLGPVPPRPQPPARRPGLHIASGVVWLVFLALALYSPWFFWVWGGRGVFSPSDALYAMRFPLWLLVFAGISQSWLARTRFAASSWRKVLRAGVAAAGVALAIYLLWSGDLLVAGPRWDPSQAKPLATLNQMIGGVLATGCILVGLAFLRQFVRFVRRGSSRPRTADAAS
jgi:hypothetical protein